LSKFTTTHTAGTYTLNQSLPANEKVTTYLFFDSMQVVENTFGSIISIGGNLSPNFTFLNLQFNQIAEIKNNLFLSCKGFLNIIDLSNNKLSSNEVNKLLIYLYEALQNGSLKITPSNTFSTNNQNPLAPPSNDVGIQQMISALAQNNWTIVTD